MDPIYRQTFSINDAAVDCFGRLKPSMVLFFAQETAGRHCDLLNLDWDTMASRRLFWAIIRHRVQITRLPMSGETITVETWPLPTTRVAYPRSTVAYDENGNELFRSICLWVLMDLDTRSMILPGKSGVTVNGLLRGSELAVPGSLLPKSLDNVATRTVAFTDLDRNGHMNNTRCLDWLNDLLPSAFHKTHTPKEFTVCYHAEAKEGQELQLNWQILDGPVLQLDAMRDTPDAQGATSRVFTLQVRF